MSTALTSSNPPEVFISYSHKDEEWLERLVTYLDVLKNEGVITFWYGRRIPPGKEWEKEIDKHLRTAQVVLLLVTEAFLESEYCYSVEFKKAMERHELETACAVPVILRSCEWKNTPMAKLEALPLKGKAIEEWERAADAFESITDGIRQVVKDLPAPIKQVRITIDEWVSDRFNLEVFRGGLSYQVGVDLNRITISIQRGSLIISIEGDVDELARIVKALRNPKTHSSLFPKTSLKSLTYIQGQQEHSIPIRIPIEVLFREARRAFPVVKYALVLAVIAAALTIVAGFSSDYRILLFGAPVMVFLVFGLVSFSSLAIHSSASLRPLALFLAWTFVLLTSGASFFIFTGFFFDWPRPLEAYVRAGSTPSPTPTPEHSPTPEPDHSLTPTPEYSPTPPPQHSPTPTPQPSQTPSPGPSPQNPRIFVITYPPYDPVGGPDSQALIVGKVSGVRPEDYYLVIYSFTNAWYVQPDTEKPKTLISPEDGTWRCFIHTGTLYDIFLFPMDYPPPLTRPTQMSGVVKWIEFEGKK